MPHTIVALLAQAKQQLTAGRVEATVHDLQSILQTNPDHAEALHGAAISLTQLEEPRPLAYPGGLARRDPNAARPVGDCPTPFVQVMVAPKLASSRCTLGRALRGSRPDGMPPA